MRLRSQIIITAILTVVVAGGWLLWTDGGDGSGAGAASTRKPSAATGVLVEPLEFATDKVVVRAIGTGEALKSASIYPSVAGEVMEVAFRAEQKVGKGDVLMRLDDKHQRLAVRLAQVAAKEARRQAGRLEKLAPTGAASQARLETAQTAYESAIVRLEQAKAALQDRTIIAPFDGVIGLTDIQRGDRVTTDTLITTLDDRSRILVQFELPEEYARRIALGDDIALRPWTMPDRVVQGTVSDLGSRIDPVTRTLRVKARIDNPDADLRPGTSFEVRLDFKGKDYPKVREVAVLWSRDGAYIWRVADKRAEKVFVKIVRRERDGTLVDGPLARGDLIVVEGVQGLRVGQPVKATPFGKNALGNPAAGKKKGKS